MSRTLLLNATFEPLCIVSFRRAVVLVLKDKAEIVARDVTEFHAERVSVPCPSVIRLVHFVLVPYRSRAPLSRRGVFARDDHRCQYCNRPAENLDHVIPRSRGGEHSWENVVAACKRCNSSKRDRFLHETNMHLPHAPRTPSFMARFVLVDRRVPDVWSRYLVRAQDGVARSA